MLLVVILVLVQLELQLLLLLLVLSLGRNALLVGRVPVILHGRIERVCNWFYHILVQGWDWQDGIDGGEGTEAPVWCIVGIIDVINTNLVGHFLFDLLVKRRVPLFVSLMGLTALA